LVVQWIVCFGHLCPPIPLSFHTSLIFYFACSAQCSLHVKFSTLLFFLRFDILTVKMSLVVLWVVIPCSLVSGTNILQECVIDISDPEDGSDVFLQNVDNCQQDTHHHNPEDILCLSFIFTLLSIQTSWHGISELLFFVHSLF
jgi:hypothetical protein